MVRDPFIDKATFAYVYAAIEGTGSILCDKVRKQNEHEQESMQQWIWILNTLEVFFLVSSILGYGQIVQRSYVSSYVILLLTTLPGKSSLTCQVGINIVKPGLAPVGRSLMSIWRSSLLGSTCSEYNLNGEETRGMERKSLQLSFWENHEKRYLVHRQAMQD